MSHKGGIHAVQKCLQDLNSNNQHIFGGITVLFSGDFRQILPVIPNGTKTDELNACIKYSLLWKDIIKLTLTSNMRLKINQNIKASDFSKKNYEYETVKKC